MSVRGWFQVFFAAGKLWSEYRLLLLGAGLIGCVCQGAALDVFLLASLRLNGSECKLLLFECLLARL